jgi:hypothetical protein
MGQILDCIIEGFGPRFATATVNRPGPFGTLRVAPEFVVPVGFSAGMRGLLEVSPDFPIRLKTQDRLLHYR